MTDKKKPAKGKGATSNQTNRSLVKTVVLEDLGKWIQPKSGQVFFIDEDANFPNITFEIETQETGPYEWSLSISWPAAVSGLKESAKRGKVFKTFSKVKESFMLNSKSCSVNFTDVIGGTFTAQVKAGKETFKRSVHVRGKNPGKDRVVTFLNTIEDIKGFEKLLEQESKFKHFIDADHMPVVAFDGGYGLTQMTTPAPNFEQIWNWKENIRGGTSLYKTKQKSAKTYLSQNKRTYTDEQLKLETWSRWNGGVYHVWDDKNKAWVRNNDIMCDPVTGNIGWDMTLQGNKGESLEDLHDRDEKSYKTPKKKAAENKWKYTGTCYADHLNN
jgi:hypothetical protein